MGTMPRVNYNTDMTESKKEVKDVTDRMFNKLFDGLIALAKANGNKLSVADLEGLKYDFNNDMSEGE